MFALATLLTEVSVSSMDINYIKKYRHGIFKNKRVQPSAEYLKDMDHDLHPLFFVDVYVRCAYSSNTRLSRK